MEYSKMLARCSVRANCIWQSFPPRNNHSDKFSYFSCPDGATIIIIIINLERVTGLSIYIIITWA